MQSSEILFFLGCAVMAVTALGAVFTGVLLRLSGKRLKKQLDEEFGEKRL